MTKNEIGCNAGIVWRLMSNRYLWTYAELKEKSGLSDWDLLTAIGWLARENQIEFDDTATEQRFYLNRSFF